MDWCEPRNTRHEPRSEGTDCIAFRLLEIHAPPD